MLVRVDLIAANMVRNPNGGGLCRLQCAQAVARSYQALQPHAENLDQLRIVHSFTTSFDADAYVKKPRAVKQLRQDVMLLRHGPKHMTRAKPCVVLHLCRVCMAMA